MTVRMILFFGQCTTGSSALSLSHFDSLAQVGNKQAVAAVKANAERRAANLRAIVDDLRSQGIASVRTIAAALSDCDILTPRGGTWHPTSAARLLSRLQATS
jgi:hypothetical protein